jgi:hypothetical protein
MRFLFSSNITDANHTIDMVDDLEKMTDDISALAHQKKVNWPSRWAMLPKAYGEQASIPVTSPRRSSISSFMK